MKMKVPTLAFTLPLLMCAMTLLQPMMVAAQEQEEGEKSIRSAEVIGNRKRGTAPATTIQSRRTYTANRKRPKTPPAQNQEDVRLGLTVFRYEPPGTTYRDGAEGTKDIGFEGEEEAPTPPKEASAWKSSDWTRAIPQTQFAVGQVMRLHFEPLTQSGYLYIIHQELYADGTTGEAKLLFPTLKMNGGDNLIRANRDLWIPRTGAYFRILPSSTNKRHVGELFTAVLRSESPAQILPQAISDKPMPLPSSVLNKLISGAGSEVIRMNLDNGEGQRLTTRETEEGRKDVETGGDEVLTAEDEPPQTIYEARRKAGQPVMIRIPLRFKPE